jgi:GNAT superfamily N-acetyltransferase
MNIEKSDKDWFLPDMSIKKIDHSTCEELQTFLDHFKDFFMLCEGVSPSATNVLQACPISKDISQDKLCLGIYKDTVFIAFIDIIKNYPTQNVLTIGYFLIHPSYRLLGLGSKIIHFLTQWTFDQGFTKLRLSVQSQNLKALAFWQKNDFNIVKKIKEELGKKTNETYILEYVSQNNDNP